MLVAELKGRRPKRAGKAFLEYDDQCETPFRKDDTIILPSRGELLLCELQPNWNQFIARFDYSTVWFGGTDENPFLVRIDDHPFSEYCRYGPRGFYQSLIPVLPSRNFRRQGDIFACLIPFTWEELLRFYSYTQGWKVKIEESGAKDGQGLFRTRHILKGVTLNQRVHMAGETDERVYEEPWFTLAEGTIAAPDHTDMKLEGVSVLAQTRYLHDPQKAD